MKAFMVLIKFLLGIALLIALILGGIILYALMTDYKPQEKETVEAIGNGNQTITKNDLSFLIWNIGFCGLGENADFFYDGGKMVRSPQNDVESYYQQAKTFLNTHKNTDFVLLQEVDKGSKRSYYLNEFEGLNKEVFSNMNASFGKNYDVNFVPLPFTNPLGCVESGLGTYTPYKSTEITRYQFPGNFAFPKALFFLDRCFLLQRFPAPNGKEVIVINTHNSAYDNGNLKEKQMEYLRNILLEEYKKGNYVIVGGDWNQTPPGFNNNTFLKKGGQEASEQIAVAFDYMPEGWIWAYDASVPTNRKLSEPYSYVRTFTTVIDFYLLSPNIKLKKVEGIDLKFKASDHQPVYMEIELMN